MTTEDDFQRALDAHPEDWQTRLVFADWLQEQGDPRAEGYRALGAQRRVPVREFGYWAYWVTSTRTAAQLPQDWWNEWRAGIGKLLGVDPETPAWELPRNTLPFRRDTRREAEDIAALAFAKLPARRRAELLATQPVGAA